ncbi:MAG: hypothetical protein HYU53_15575 [Acidobacteria bacterium]|nr:hypothetical protein [Acidobacteriota bacterium]
MTARTVRLLASLAFAVVVAACTSFYEIPIETPIQPKLDVSAFQRVLVAGFVAGGTEDVDANQETVRLLRSQLRTKSNLKVIEADALPLLSILNERDGVGSVAPLAPVSFPAADGQEASPQPAPQAQTTRQEEPKIKNEKDLEQYERIFADVSYWKKIGEEYQQPLIITGTILFVPHSKAGIVQREREFYDSFGRRRVEPVRAYMERKGYILQPKFVFIDGRTGTVLYSERFREERLYSPQQNTPALSSYFELMDQILPSFLSTLSTQKIRGTRVLLK